MKGHTQLVGARGINTPNSFSSLSSSHLLIGFPLGKPNESQRAATFLEQESRRKKVESGTRGANGFAGSALSPRLLNYIITTTWMQFLVSLFSS